MKDKTQKKIERLEARIEELEAQNTQETIVKNEEVSRRGFLKKIGAGAAGLGALAMVPSAASKISINTNSITKDGTSLWYSGLGSNYDVSGSDLVDGGTTIWSNSNSHVPATSVQTAGLDADTVDGKEADEIRTLPIVVPAVNLADSETIQISRFTLPTGKKLYVWKAAVADTSGASVANLTVEAYDNTAASSVYSTSNNTMQEGSPLASSNAGNDIELRVSNSSGSAVNAHAVLICTIED